MGKKQEKTGKRMGKRMGFVGIKNDAFEDFDDFRARERMERGGRGKMVGEERIDCSTVRMASPDRTSKGARNPIATNRGSCTRVGWVVHIVIFEFNS